MYYEHFSKTVSVMIGVEPYRSFSGYALEDLARGLAPSSQQVVSMIVFFRHDQLFIL